MEELMSQNTTPNNQYPTFYPSPILESELSVSLTPPYYLHDLGQINISISQSFCPQNPNITRLLLP